MLNTFYLQTHIFGGFSVNIWKFNISDSNLKKKEHAFILVNTFVRKCKICVFLRLRIALTVLLLKTILLHRSFKKL